MTRHAISTEDAFCRKHVSVLDTDIADIDVGEGYPTPKLSIDAERAGFLIGAQREFCRAWPNQETVLVKGAHFLQEEEPEQVGEAIARFVAKVLARQIS